ncbi:MAG: S41 family peptidase [Polyangiaceae bacterium]|nr:S41 family peptidase [Polyangiaceae bacterium]
MKSLYPLSASFLRPLLCFSAGIAVATVGSVAIHTAAAEDRSTAWVTEWAGVLARVEREYVDPVERAKLVRGAIKGMVEELDPHSSYLTSEELHQLFDDTEGKFAGVGIEVDVRSDSILVIAPLEGSPAEKGGIKSGDEILAVNHEKADPASFEKTLKKIRGPVGTHVIVTVRRVGIDKPMNLDLVREEVRVSSVEWTLFKGQVGYLRIKQFQERTYEEFLRAAGDLRTRGATSLVLDMRYNPGGLVNSASAIADEFVDSGVLYTTRRRGLVETTETATPAGVFVSLPVAILVNEWSASAAELVAGALQDHKRARVFGSKTFGKGSVQTIVELPSGAGLKLTTARYFTPSGHSLQAEGITPDVVFEPDSKYVFQERHLGGHLPKDPEARSSEVIAFDGSLLGVDAGAPRRIRKVRDLPSDPGTSEDRALAGAYGFLVSSATTRSASLTHESQEALPLRAPTTHTREGSGDVAAR